MLTNISLWIVMYDNCGNGNDEYRIICGHKSKDEADKWADNCNNKLTRHDSGYYLVEETVLWLNGV